MIFNFWCVAYPNSNIFSQDCYSTNLIQGKLFCLASWLLVDGNVTLNPK